MLVINGLEKRFFVGTPGERLALAGVDLALSEGTFCIVIGSNGAGKSTLLNAIAGRFPAAPGQIMFDGRDIGRLALHRRAKLIARVFQDPMTGTAARMTVEENLLLAELRPDRRRLRWGLTARRRIRWRDRLAALGLGLENRLEDRIETLSGGQRQACSLVMAVLRQPRLLLLDEHTAALDPVTADLVMRATIRVVEEERITTLMVTHNMRHAVQAGDRLIMMEMGRIRLSMDGPEKRGMTVDDLVARFRDKDDRILLAR